MTQHYLIGDHLCRFVFDDADDAQYLPSLKPFAISDEQAVALGDTPLFTLTVDDTPPIPKAERVRLHVAENSNGDILVDQRPSDGAYQFTLKNSYGNNCCLIVVDSRFTDCHVALRGDNVSRSYGLNSAIMLIYSFSSCFKQTLLIHASVVRHGDYAYAFTAKSGTGKSTHVSKWLEAIPGCDLLNDDNPIIRLIDGQPYIYGSPWSGKTPCYRNIRARLGAISLIVRDTQNKVESVQPVQALATMLSGVSNMIWDSAIFNTITQNISDFIAATPMYDLHCLPNIEAAQVSAATLTRIEQ